MYSTSTPTRWLSLLLVCLSSLGSATAQNVAVERDKAVVPAISGRGLGMVSVGGIPVNLYTGTASPNYPLSALSGRNITIPINLAYTAGSGVQVTSIASEVGTGWVLNASGSISCEVRGRPDEADTGPKSWMDPVFTRTIGDNYTALRDVQSKFCEGRDTEYDVYHLVAPGLQADFVMSGPYGQPADQRNDIVVLNNRHLTVTPTYWTNSRKIRSFSATDEAGTQYSFDQAESMRVQTETKRTRDGNLSSKDDYTYVAKWHLRSIRSTTGDVVNFYYDSSYGAPIQYKSFTSIRKKYAECDAAGNNCIDRDASTAPRQDRSSEAVPGVEGGYETTTTIKPTLVYHISSISAATGSVRFYRGQQERRDAPGEKALDKIVLLDPEDRQLQSFSFTYSYFGPSANSSPEEVRLRLDRITTKNSGCQATGVDLKYREYGPTASRTTVRRDHWGYFNDNLNPAPIGRNRTPSTGLTAQNCLLYKLQYGTGAYTELGYGNHRDATGATVGGVRLEQVRLHDGMDAAKDQVFTINYNVFVPGSASNSTTSSASYVKPPPYIEWQNVRSFTGGAVCNPSAYKIDKYEYSSSESVAPIPADYIQYQWATVQLPNRSRTAYQFSTGAYYPDKYNPLSVKVSTNLGYGAPCSESTDHYPIGSLSCGDPAAPRTLGEYAGLPQDERPYGIADNNIERRGLVLQQIEVNSEGKLSSQIDNQYDLTQTDPSPLRSIVVVRERYAFGHYFFSYYYNAKVYQHERTWIPLTKQTAVRYDQRRGNTGAIATQTQITEYSYRNYYVAQVKTYNPAGGDAQVVAFSRAQDVGAPAVLLNAKDYSSIVVKRTYRLDATNTQKATIITYYDYQSNPNNYVRPVRTGVWDVSAGNQTQYQTQAVEFDDYSNVVNVQSISGLWSGTAWGYKQLLPIATVANGKFTTPASGGIATAGHTSFEEDYDPNWNTGTTYTGEAKTGRRSVRLSTPNGVYGPGKLFTIEPANQRGKYVFSCWAKVPRGEGGQSTVTLVTYISPPSGSNSWRGTSTTVSSGQDWQLCRTVLDLDEPAIRATLSAGQNITIQCYPWISSGSGNVLVDEVRFHPEAARMTTATYQLLVGRTSATDENNVTTYYEYDAENQPLLVRDDKGNILQRTKISSTATTQETITGVAQTGGSSYPNTSVTFTADASGCASNLTYSWNFGDGATAKGAGVQAHTYAQSGTYPLTVVAEAPGFNPVEKTLAVQVVAALNVYATYGGRNYVDLCRTNDTGRDVRITLQPQQGCVGYTYRWEASEYTASNGSWGPWTDSNNSTDTFNYYHDVPRKLQVRCTVTDVCGNSLVYSDRFETSKSDPNCNNIAQ